MLPRFLVPLLLVLTIDVYGFLALRTLWSDQSSGARFGWSLAWWSVPALALGYFVLVATNVEPKLPKGLTVLVRAALFIAYLAKFFAVVFFLIDDLRRLVTGALRSVRSQDSFWPDRSRFLTQLGIVAGGLPAAILTYGIIRNPYRYELRSVRVPIQGLPAGLDGLRIVQISDIHSGSFFRKHPIRDGIRAINDLGADVAFFTGDLVNARAPEIEPYLDLFSRIEATHGVYSTIGNHDYGDYVAGWTEEDKRRNWEQLYGYHRDLGWDLLLNDNRVLTINGERLAVIGVENWSTIPRFPRTGDLVKASIGVEHVPTKVLLSHDPTHWDAQVSPNRPDIQLTLSGHTHGFQFGVEIPGFRWSPSQYIYEQWAGLYTRGNQHLYVNRGFGFLGYPGRVGILPEIALLTLETA